MWTDNLQNIDPNKIAIESDSKRISYGQLLEITRKKCQTILQENQDFLLCSNDEIVNLVNFLSIILAGKKAIFGGKNLNEFQKITLAENFNLKILDSAIPESEIKTINPFKNKFSDLFLGVLSSGSEGHQKVIWKDYQSWFSAFKHQSEVFGINESDKVMIVDALSYSANLNSALHALSIGATIYLTKLSKGPKWTEIIKNNEVTSIFMVPSHYRLLVHDEIKIEGINSLVSAGEKLDIKTAEKLLDKCKNALLTEYYGAAELGHISYLQDKDLISHPNSVGKAFPGVKIALKNQKIWIESEYVSPDYRKHPTVNDLGEFDQNGYLYVLGREGRMFNRRGLNIYAEEIENIANLHPFVIESVLIAGKKESEIVLLVVTSKPISKKELHEFLLSKLPLSKIPNFIQFQKEIPRNTNGKINFKILAKKPTEEENV